MRYLAKTAAARVGVAVCLFLLSAQAVFAQQSKPASVTTSDGLQVLVFDLVQGKIKINLPDDMAAGDTISGTVTTEPYGRDDSEKTKNDGILRGMVLRLDEKTEVPVGNPRFDWMPPMPQTRPRSKFLIRIVDVVGNDGKLVSSGNLPINTIKPPSVPDLQLPKLGQTGRPLSVPGMFDGNSSNTSCSLGGRPVDIIAESPRQTVFRVPTDLSGPTDINIGETGNQKSGTVRLLSVALSATKTTLRKGERTNVHLEIKGLKGESESIPFRLVTTGTANMQGGNLQIIQIEPRQISPDGTFVRDFDLTGTSSGAFSVTASINKGQPVGSQEKCKCNCEFAKPAITSDTKRGDAGSGTENTFAANMKRADCTGSKCSVQGISTTWSIGAGSTATYKIREGTDKSGKLIVEVTKGGTLVITVTVKVTCSDGTECSATATETITVKS